MNRVDVWFRSGAGTALKATLGCLAAVLALALPPAFAGTEMTQVAPPAPVVMEKDWTLELGSGVTFSNVRSGLPNRPYTIVPISLTASLALDDVSLGGWLRGYSEFYFRGDYDNIIRGPETHYEGLLVGPRYNFVQPGWKLIPYVEGGVGFDFADSNPAAGGLGQDFNFSFEVGAGAKYQFTDSFYARLGVEYQHLSNAGLSEPATPNHPIDALGPKLSFGFAF
jgi:opacity protein-like surface antigen